jgi:ABC-type transporter Mla subunit MlaD
MLVIVVLWALTAVIFLTGILAAANRIESRVGVINNALTPINSKLNTVPVLTQVSNTANQIRDAASNLSPTIGRITDNAASIDQSLKNVGAVVGPINKTVHSIDGELAGTLDNVYDIRSRVVTATNQADDINRSAKTIDGDATFISNIVGSSHFTGTINGNAHGIETSPLLLRLENGAVIRKMIAESHGQDPAAAQASLPSLDLLPQISQLGLPALPALPTTQLPSVLTNLLQGLPVLGDTGDLLGQVVAPPKK